jgi:hypothetical protein
MQLCLQTADLELIANVLLECEGRIMAAPCLNRAESAHMRSFEILLERVLARDTRFDYDELDQLLAILTEHKRQITNEIAYQLRGAAKSACEEKLNRLERVLEKIEEVYVMA